MKKYQKYKNSGIEWIGKIPNHWKMGKLKYYFDLSSGKNPKIIDKTEGLYPVYGSNGVIGYSDEYELNFKTILIGRVGSSGEVQINEFPCSVTDNCLIVKREKDDNLRFIYYLLIHTDLKQYTTKTSQPLITSTTIKNIKTFFPPLSEQKQIVSFLDYKTKKIDELVEKTEKKIELLKEKRTALINYCVTKGLPSWKEGKPGTLTDKSTKVQDLPAEIAGKNEGIKKLRNEGKYKDEGSKKLRNEEIKKYKDSGIEWIGEIPRNCKIIQLKYLTTKVGSGVTPRGGSEVYCEKGIPFLRSQNIHFQGLELNDVVFISEEIHNQMSSSKVIPNDVLFNITGASIGRCYYTKPNSTEFNVNQHVCIIRPNEKILTKFLYFYLSSDNGQIQVAMNNTGSGKEGLNFQNLKSFLIVYFDKEKQQQIVEYLDEQTEIIDNLIEKETRRIELLKEYRQALISEVVTGKVDVRGWSEP